ncbi:MAG TPA: hypothetical protein VKL61_00010 [Candidatus Polarisedimenticolia bacterium]|nr:hypothetical protein [Candidatus Polarisedimenticolia bacterium]
MNPGSPRRHFGRRSKWPGWVSADHLLCLLLTLTIAVAVLQPIRTYDLWWHLATGRLILEQGRIPSAEPFSFTRQGTPWLDHEWLFQILCFLIYRLAGWPALLLADLLLILGAFALLFGILRHEGCGVSLACPILLLSVAGARFRFDPRPEILSLFFLVLLCSLLRSSREPGMWRKAWALPPLFLLWANLHPAALLGAVLLFLWLAGEGIQAITQRRSDAGDPRRTLVALVSPLMLLANPGGWRLLVVPMTLRRIVSSGHAPNLEWEAPTFRDFPLLYLAVTVSFLLLLVGWRELDLAAVLVMTAGAALALLHLRNIGFFFVLLPFGLAGPVARLSDSVRFPPRLGRALCASLLALVGLLFARGNVLAGERGYLASVAPERAVDFIQARGIGQRLFNDVKFGGYLIWRRYPERRVFIDGRNEIYDTLLAEIFQGLRSWEEWESLLKRHGIDAALLRRGQVQAVEYPPATPGGMKRREMRAFSAAYFQISRWALVYWDDQALLFVRRDDPASEALLRGEYRFVNPDDVAHLEVLIRNGDVERNLVLKELARKRAEDPSCLTAQVLLEQFAGSDSREN